MPFMTRIPADLAAFGLRVETVPGWETRGSSSFAPAGVVCHWTAGPANSTTRPSLSVVVNGRPGLDGPLCNVYLARDGVCVVVAAGRANHAGAGSWKGLVGNSAMYGIEAEAANNSDWTTAQRAAYPRLVAALLKGLGRDLSWACGHSEWAGPRKTDINGYTPAGLRSQGTAILSNPHLSTVQEDDMTPEDRALLLRTSQLVEQTKATLQAVYDGLYRGGGSTPEGEPLMDFIGSLPARINAAQGASQPVDLAAVTAAAKEGGKQGASEALAEGVKVTIDVPNAT